MRYDVTKIQKIASKLVLFWSGSDLLKPITIIHEFSQTGSLIRLLTDDGWVEFDAYLIEEITDGTSSKTYTPLALLTTISADYKSRFQDIWQFLVLNILRGCCCEPAAGSSNISFVTTLPETGESGILYIQTSDDTSWYWNGTTWAELGGASTVPNWQQTLDVSSALDKDNTIDGGGFIFDFTKVLDFIVESTRTGSIIASATGANQAYMEVYDNGTTPTAQLYAYNDASGEEGTVMVNTASRVAYIKYGPSSLGFYAYFDRILVRTPNIAAGSSVVGYVLILQQTNGRSEWGQIDTIGLKKSAVSNEKLADMPVNTFKGNIDIVSAPPTDLTVAQMQSALGITPITPSGLTGFNDTNVTIAFGGTPASALLQAVSITLGWTGTLADARIASAATWNAKLSTYRAPFQIDCNSDQVNASSTSYYNIYTGSGVDGTEATRQNVVPIGGTAKGYCVHTLSSQPASGSAVFTIRKGGANTALTLTIAAGSAAGIFTNNTNSFSVTKQLDLLSYQVVNNATAATAQIKSQSFVIESNE